MIHDSHLESGEGGDRREGGTTFSNLRLKQSSVGVSQGSARGGCGRGGLQTCEGERFVTRSSPRQEPFGSPGGCLPEAALSDPIGDKQG